MNRHGHEIEPKQMPAEPFVPPQAMKAALTQTGSPTETLHPCSDRCTPHAPRQHPQMLRRQTLIGTWQPLPNQYGFGGLGWKNAQNAIDRAAATYQPNLRPLAGLPCTYAGHYSDQTE